MTYFIDDDFSGDVRAQWHVREIGSAQVTQPPGTLRMTVGQTPEGRYSDAQISDYGGRRDFRWEPPATLTVRARAEGRIQGTAGFGFWNHPFEPGERVFRLPRAVWFFFASSQSNMALAKGVPGHGWKAATFDATRWPFFALLPAAPVGFLLMRVPILYRWLWPIGQRALSVSEQLLDSDLLAETHTYRLDWRRDHVDFALDGGLIHRANVKLGGPLGFIAWIDNQYAVVTPQGHFELGLLPAAQPQTLILEHLTLKTGDA